VGHSRTSENKKIYCTQDHFDHLVKMIKFPAQAENIFLEMETDNVRNIAHFYISHAFHFDSGRSQTHNCTALRYVTVTELRSSVGATDFN
jgi:hypothetical protein